jgi:homoserine kinase
MAPAFRGGTVKIRVPASSANLGPGFDALGLALGLYDVVAVQVTDSGLTVQIAGEGEDTLRRDKRNLVVRSMRETFAVLGGQPRGLAVVCANRIPHSRGLGSSSAAIVAGVCAARAVVLGGMPDDEVLRIATQIEGHADNVAACLYGGATTAWMDASGSPRAVRLPVAPNLAAVAFVPGSSRQSTKAARAALSETVPFGVAARTAGRAALLVHALGADPSCLFAATDDELHQPPRLVGQPRAGAQLSVLRDAGIAAVLSGSGPSVLALCTSADQAEAAAGLAQRGMTAMPLAVDTTGATQLKPGE